MRICENCTIEHDGNYASGRFCSSKCSRSFSTKVKRQQINNRVSNTLSGRGHGPISKVCEICKKQFDTIWSKRTQRFCSLSCSSVYKNDVYDSARKAGIKSASSQKKRSKNEELFYELCLSEFLDCLANENFFDGWDADIIIHSEKIAILWNGIWHYKQISKKQSLKQVQTRDSIKVEKIKLKGYFPYIIKDMGKYNPDFVKQEFKKLKEYIAGKWISTTRVS